MVETRIEGRHGTTIFNDSFGMSIGGRPHVEEPPREAPKRLTRSDIEKRFGWTAEQFDAATGHYGFPRPLLTERGRMTWQGRQSVRELAWVESAARERLATSRTL